MRSLLAAVDRYFAACMADDLEPGNAACLELANAQDELDAAVEEARALTKETEKP